MSGFISALCGVIMVNNKELVDWLYADIDELIDIDYSSEWEEYITFKTDGS